LGAVTLDVTASYSEKEERLAVTLESTGLLGNPLKTADLPKISDLGGSRVSQRIWSTGATGKGTIWSFS